MAAALLPALSFSVPDEMFTAAPLVVVDLVKLCGEVPATSPEVPSLAVKPAVCSPRHQPFSPGTEQESPAGRRPIEGALASRLIVTDSVLDPPALVAVQVKVTPVVSELTVPPLQPADLELTVDSGSVTSKLTFTLLVYQPLSPSVPTTDGVITGAVVSVGTGVRTWKVPDV